MKIIILFCLVSVCTSIPTYFQIKSYDTLLRKAISIQESNTLDYSGHFWPIKQDGNNSKQTPEIEQWTVQQKIVNDVVNESIERNKSINQEVKYRQMLLNRKAQVIIDDLIRKQAFVNSQIEQKLVISKMLITEQRFVYRQVQYMLRELVRRETFLIDIIRRCFASGWGSPDSDLFNQRGIVYRQVRQLIEQILAQQNCLRRQIKDGNVSREELLVYQKITYRQVELYVQSLIEQLVEQQEYFQDLFRFFVRRKQPIPQELVPQQTTICIELTQLISGADFVPQELVDKEQRLHHEIILLLKEAYAISHKTPRY
ncbi:uncharacterized protein LOC130450087 [Diorhabda sublineata]|uniref:uncharacterized protein LOC130450087 n=1 Tax=Diorhabda sublineata TaxID=1163346 RepID=UPI0024E05E11|nr:uncharacterized protein LOC130450087 [Diorhabda sublineata]